MLSIDDLLSRQREARLAALPPTAAGRSHDWLGVLTGSRDGDLGSTLVRLARMAATVHEQEAVLGRRPDAVIDATSTQGVTR